MLCVEETTIGMGIILFAVCCIIVLLLRKWYQNTHISFDLPDTPEFHDEIQLERDFKHRNQIFILINFIIALLLGGIMIIIYFGD